MVAGRQASRPHSAARGVRQHLLRRPQAQPPVHGGEPVDLRGVYRDPRRSAGLTRSAIAKAKEASARCAAASISYPERSELMQEADKYFLSGVAIITAILMTTNDASAETMIDRGAKPYFIAGGVIATTFFIS